MRFLPCPQLTKDSDSDNVWMTHAKIAQISLFFPQILHLSSNTRVQNLAFYFQFTAPARKLTHKMKFEHVWMTRNLETPQFFTTLGQRNAKNQTQKDTNFGNTTILWHFRSEKCQNPTQKDTNFGNAIILHYLGPENHQIQPRKTQILYRTALTDPSKNANKIRKVFIFPEFCTLFEMHSLTPSTLTKQQLGNT